MPKTPAPPVPCDAARRREVIAAAEVGRRILQTVAESYELAADLLHGSADLAS